MIIGHFALLLRDWTFLPSVFFTKHALQIGSVIEVILFSFGLGEKISQTQKEKVNIEQQLITTQLVSQQKTNRELIRLNKLKDDFIAKTSHELRTPLNGIIGITESIMDGSLGMISDKIKSNLALVESSAKRLFGLVNDLLDTSRLKNRDISLNLVSVDLRSMVSVILQMSESSLKVSDVLTPSSQTSGEKILCWF